MKFMKFISSLSVIPHKPYSYKNDHQLLERNPRKSERSTAIELRLLIQNKSIRLKETLNVF
jgi:hypothetical protein